MEVGKANTQITRGTMRTSPTEKGNANGSCHFNPRHPYFSTFTCSSVAEPRMRRT